MPAMPQGANHQNLLRAMDALMDHSEAVEVALARQIRPLVDHDPTIVFHDLTTVRIHGEGKVDDDLRAFGMNKETGGIARRFVLGVVQTAEGLPSTLSLEPMAQPCRRHTVHPGNMAETKTLQAMLKTVLQRFPVQRVILVADILVIDILVIDRGLPSLDNIGELTAMADQGGRKLEFILAVPARRYGELVGTFHGLPFCDVSLTEGGLAEGGLAKATFAGHRLIVAHDPDRAALQSARRRNRIADLGTMAEKLVARLDAQDAGETARGRRASDRGACSRFTRAVARAEPTRFIKADHTADRFSWSMDEDAITRAELFDGKLTLLTNAPDLTPAQAITRYKSLADIERGFRVPKSDIEIAPVHHRLPDRIRAHALICFLALVLYRIMRMRKAAERDDGFTDFAHMILENLKAAGVQQAHKEDRITFTALKGWPGAYISAEGTFMEGDTQRRAGVFIGPEFGTVSRPDLVAAAREAGDAGFDVLIACAFNYDAHSSEFDKLGRIRVLKARMNPDLHMAKDLKATGAGNLFVIFGEPDIRIADAGDGMVTVQVFGVDVFKPQTGEVQSEGTEGIALWMLDTDYNEESFFVRHAYFLGAKDPYKALKTTLKAEIDEEAWDSLYSDTSRPFAKPKSGRIAVKVINHLGNEVMKVFAVE